MGWKNQHGRQQTAEGLTCESKSGVKYAPPCKMSAKLLIHAKPLPRNSFQEINQNIAGGHNIKRDWKILKIHSRGISILKPKYNIYHLPEATADIKDLHIIKLIFLFV